MEDGRLLQQVAVFRAHQQQRQHQARPLRDQRTHGHAADAQRGVERQQPAGQHIDDIHPQVGDHREHRILHADEPALEDEERQCGRRRPDPNEEIVPGHPLHFRRAVHQQEHPLGEEPLDGQYEQRDDQRGGDALGKSADRGFHIAPAVGLGGDAARPHAQEADQGGVAQMAGDGRVDDAHQGHRDVGQDARHGEPDNFPVDGVAQGHQRYFFSSSSIPR